MTVEEKNNEIKGFKKYIKGVVLINILLLGMLTFVLYNEFNPNFFTYFLIALVSLNTINSGVKINYAINEINQVKREFDFNLIVNEMNVGNETLYLMFDKHTRSKSEYKIKRDNVIYYIIVKDGSIKKIDEVNS